MLLLVQINFYLYILKDNFLMLLLYQLIFTGATFTQMVQLHQLTITTSAAHNLEVGDIILFDSVTLPGGTGLNASDFEDKLFQVITVPSPTTFTITIYQASATSASGGSIDFKTLRTCWSSCSNLWLWFWY